MAEKKGYAGKIANAGTQEIKAPLQTRAKSGKTKVKTGGDMRTGKSK